MNLSKLMGVVLFFIILLVVVSIAPQVGTANSAAYATWNGSTEKDSMIGLDVIMPWGGFLIVLAILATTGIFTLKIKNQGFSVNALISPVIRVIIAIFILTFYSNIITSFNVLIAAESNDAVKIVWGVVLLLIYLAIIAISGGWDTFQYVRERMGKKGKAAKASGAGGVFSGGGP